MNARTETSPGWEDKLHEAGLRVTRQRMIILDLLDGLGGHHTAEGLNALLHAAETPLTLGTVYNVLDDLVGAGLAMQADRGPGTAIYELTDNWHHHFVCRQCSTFIDMPCVVDEKACLHADLPGALLEEAQVIFRGLCPDCAARQ